jgi:hypothetical protein
LASANASADRVPRPAEGKKLAVFRLAHGLLHFFNIGRTDAADDRHEMIGDSRLGRGGLDIGCERLPGFFAVGPVVHDDRYALGPPAPRPRAARSGRLPSLCR